MNKAELRTIRIHELRHTYATLRVPKGDNIQDVSNQLGPPFGKAYPGRLFPLDMGEEEVGG